MRAHNVDMRSHTLAHTNTQAQAHAQITAYTFLLLFTLLLKSLSFTEVAIFLLLLSVNSSSSSLVFHPLWYFILSGTIPKINFFLSFCGAGLELSLIHI